MIARLRGAAVARSAEGLVLDVNGVGYLVAASSAALRKASVGGGEAVVETYLHVRDDALQLYGFADAAERELFTQLLTVNGVGPKVALAIVSGSSTTDLRRAIALEDVTRFQAIPGIGKKTAERIVLELKGKVAEAVLAEAPGRDAFAARDALVELGYSLPEAEEVLAGVDPDLPVEERVRLALKAAA